MLRHKEVVVPHIPIFPCSGNRMLAVNPALVRSVETQSSGAGVKIVFDREHELLVNASLHSVVDTLWNPSPMVEIKELTVTEIV